MDDIWLRAIIAGAAGVLAVLSLAAGTAALLTHRAQPAADLLGGRSGSVRSRGRRALVLGALWSAVVLLAALLERPLYSQLAFYAALASGLVVREVYDRHHRRPGPEPLPPGAPRTSSDPVQLQQPPAGSRPPASTDEHHGQGFPR